MDNRPLASDDQTKVLEIALNKHKIDIPKWNKPLWKDVKSMPKEKRPKPPKIKKPEDFLFGISECTHAITNSNCEAVMVESTVNPRTMIQPVIDACALATIPVVCINNLKGISTSNFGIPTCCLGIKKGCLPDLNSKVKEIAKTFYLPEQKQDPEPVEAMDTSEPDQDSGTNRSQPTQCTCPYLFRTNKKTRVFTPMEGAASESVNSFKGQDFIDFSTKAEPQKKKQKYYKKMVLKRVVNNPNRIKVK